MNRCDHDTTPKTFSGYKATGRRWLVWIVIGLGILGLVIAGALSIVVPVFRFPHPTGPYAIGTLTYHWVDASRSDILNADPNARRELMVQVWYPADAHPASPYAPYMQEAEAVTAAIARIHDKPRFLFGQFGYVTTNAVAFVRRLSLAFLTAT
jgi:predicted dienelactone hydrolase